MRQLNDYLYIVNFRQRAASSFSCIFIWRVREDIAINFAGIFLSCPFFKPMFNQIQIFCPSLFRFFFNRTLLKTAVVTHIIPLRILIWLTWEPQKEFYISGERQHTHRYIHCTSRKHWSVSMYPYCSTPNLRASGRVLQKYIPLCLFL